MRSRSVWISWSWARSVADIFAFSACKAAIIAFRSAGSSGRIYKPDVLGIADRMSPECAPTDLVDGLAPTLAHETLGQSIDYRQAYLAMAQVMAHVTGRIASGVANGVACATRAAGQAAERVEQRDAAYRPLQGGRAVTAVRVGRTSGPYPAGFRVRP